jgi:hypothetical protein
MKEATPIRRSNVLLDVRGERPTRAGPIPRAEADGGPAAGDRPWGGTRAALRRVVTKWSANSESLRPRVVAWQRGAPVPALRVACAGDVEPVRPWDEGGQAHGSLHVFSVARGARWCLSMTTGSLTSSPPRGLDGVTARYKRQRNPVRRRMRRWPHLRLRRSQHPPVKARCGAERARSACQETDR